MVAAFTGPQGVEVAPAIPRCWLPRLSAGLRSAAVPPSPPYLPPLPNGLLGLACPAPTKQRHLALPGPAAMGAPEFQGRALSGLGTLMASGSDRPDFAEKEN